MLPLSNLSKPRLHHWGIEERFPAVNITNPDNFREPALLFWDACHQRRHGRKDEAHHPNMVIREQLYTYLLNTYNDADLSFDSYEKSELA